LSTRPASRAYSVWATRQDIGKYGLLDNNAEVDKQITNFSTALHNGSNVITDEIQVVHQPEYGQAMTS
jgi:hypothetical protein